MKARFSDLIQQQIKLLGHSVGRTVPFLKETSCMNQQQREQYAFIEITEKLMKFIEDNPDFNVKDFMDKFLKPSLQIWGYSLWPRDILTDLALRLAKKELRASFKRSRK